MHISLVRLLMMSPPLAVRLCPCFSSSPSPMHLVSAHRSPFSLLADVALDKAAVYHHNLHAVDIHD
jgi:hypothetical protein